MAAWYYSDGSERFGPVEASEIERLIAEGQVTATSLVWREGLEGWVEAQTEFPAAAQSGAATPPPVGAAPQPQASTAPSYGSTPSDGAQTGPDGLYVGAPGRSFGEAISVCFSKYATFSGRASRSEYWFFTLFNLLVGFVTGFADALLFPHLLDVSPLNTIYSLIVLLPSMAVAWRRLHDTDRSGWWVGGFYLAIFVVAIVAGVSFAGNPAGSDGVFALIGLLGIAMLVYIIVLIVFFCQKGQPGPNRFG